jgi:hypothetical protein
MSWQYDGVARHTPTSNIAPASIAHLLMTVRLLNLWQLQTGLMAKQGMGPLHFGNAAPQAKTSSTRRGRRSPSAGVDLAFASPNLAAFAIDRAGPGMVDLVRGQASFGQIISRDRTSRAHIIAAGRIDAEVGAVLASERLRIALEALSRTYDHVVIDAGAMPASVEVVVGVASRAILVTTGVAATAEGEDLVTGGFKDVTVAARPAVVSGGTDASVLHGPGRAPPGRAACAP